MVIDLLYTLGILCTFFVLGIFIVRAFFGVIDTFRVLLATLVGMAIAIICSAWLLALSIDLKWLLPVLLVLSLFGYLVMRLQHQRLGKFDILSEFGNIKSSFIYLATILASGSAYIFLQNNQLTKARLAFRAGPDLVGWVSAGQSLCHAQNLSMLSQSIRQQLHIPNVLLAFRDGTTFPSTSIDRIPSFTNQINAEFLIGAHRFGLPALQGGVCRVLGTDSIYHLTVALMALSAALIATMATLIIKNFSMRIELKVLAIFLCAVNVNILSVSMEGGFGQLIATPFLIFLLLCLSQSKWRNQYLPIALFLLIGYALSTYLDVLFAAGPLVFIYFVVQIREVQRRSGKSFRHYLKIREKAPRLLLAVIFGLVAGWPLWPSLLRLVLAGVSGAGTAGGWDQGRIPLPSDFGGFFNWLPSDGVHNIPRGLGLGILETLFSLLILYIISRSKNGIFRSYILTIFYVYTALMLIVYKNSWEIANNYTIWKMSAYISTLMMIAVASVSNDREPSTLNASRYESPNESASLLMSAGLTLALFSTVGWSATWIGSRSFSFDNPSSHEKAFFDTHDVQIVGFYAAATTKFALQGDVHFLEAKRGANVATMRSVPARPLAYIFPPGSCQTIACLTNTIGPGAPANSNTVDPGSYKRGENKIVNGDFHSWSLGTNFNSPGETADGWLWPAAVAGTVSRQTFTPNSAPFPKDPSQYYLRWTILKNSKYDQIYQKLPDAHTFAGQSVILSFWARQISGTAIFKARIYHDFGTGGTPSSIEQVPGTDTPALNSSWQRISLALQFPSMSDKTFGKNNDSFLWVNFQVVTDAIGELDLSDVKLARPAVETSSPFRKVFSSREFSAYVQNNE